MNAITARVVKTPKPKRPRLYLAVHGKSIHDGGSRRNTTYAYENENDLRKILRDDDLLIVIPGTDEELTRERVEAAICAIAPSVDGKEIELSRESFIARKAMRELVRRLGILESEASA